MPNSTGHWYGPCGPCGCDNNICPVVYGDNVSPYLDAFGGPLDARWRKQGNDGPNVADIVANGQVEWQYASDRRTMLRSMRGFENRTNVTAFFEHTNVTANPVITRSTECVCRMRIGPLFYIGFTSYAAGNNAGFTPDYNFWYQGEQGGDTLVPIGQVPADGDIVRCEMLPLPADTFRFRFLLNGVEEYSVDVVYDKGTSGIDDEICEAIFSWACRLRTSDNPPIPDLDPADGTAFAIYDDFSWGMSR